MKKTITLLLVLVLAMACLPALAAEDGTVRRSDWMGCYEDGEDMFCVLLARVENISDGDICFADMGEMEVYGNDGGTILLDDCISVFPPFSLPANPAM